MSPWWRSALRAFYASRKTWCLALVGRGGGKSTTLTRVAACEGLFTARVVPPGQTWWFPFLSVLATDARARIVEIQAILRAVGLEVDVRFIGNVPTIEALDAHGNAIAWKAMAATVAGVSGPSTIGAMCDEEQKWRDRNTSANPATEVIASLIATSRARLGWRAIRCSSAWSTDGSHAAAVREGDTAEVCVARIGDEHIHDARTGLLAVAAWEEQARGDRDAASTIRAYAGRLTADSPRVPTWIGNPSNGAVRSREMMEGTPATALDGLTRTSYWLREYASLSPDDYEAQAWGDIGIGGVPFNVDRSDPRRTHDGSNPYVDPRTRRWWGC
jgi:hypothetical protein